MPWDSESIRKHNHKLKGAKAKRAAAIANAVLKRTGNEGLALREANGVVKKSAAHKLYPTHE